MTVTTQDDFRRAPTPAPPTPDSAGTLEFKTTRDTPQITEIVDIDEAEGLVTAIVSVTGVRDHVKDRIHPGSYAETLTARRPKVAHHHDWKKPVGRVEEIKELPPGSPELPEKTGDGKPWPENAGALKATMRYNLAKQAGRDAFADVVFYSKTGECEWSIGYRVPKGKATRSKDGVREIKGIDLYEISFVLFGAAPGTGTLAVKDSTGQPEPSSGSPAGDAAVAEESPPAPAAPPAVPPTTAPDGGRSPEQTEGEAATGRDTATDGGPEPATEPNRESGGEPEDGQADDEVPTGEDGAQVDWAAVERIADAVTLPEGPEDDQDDEGEDEGGDVAAETGDAGQDAGERDTGEQEVDEKAIAAQPVFDAEIKRAFSPGKRREHAKAGVALPDGSYPIANVGDLKNAIKAFGRAKPADRAKVKRHIAKRARALGRADLLPAGWGSAKAEKKDTVTEADVAAIAAGFEEKQTHISLDRSPRKNWVEVVGQLPAYIQHIAKDLHTKRGMPLSQAIPTAINAVKRWAAGGGDVKADTRAKAVKAVAEWEKLKAKAAFRRLAKGYDPDLENGPYAGHLPPGDVVESTAYPYLPGTFEEVRAQIGKALTGRARPGRDGAPLVSIDATWHDRVIATWFPPGAPAEARSYELPYRFDSEGKVWLGEPTEVQLSVAGDRLDSEPFPHPGLVDDLAEELKTYLLHEGKAGRVLSATNANHLRGAVEQLVAVLRTAGIEILQRDKEFDEAQNAGEPALPDSTAPAAQPAMVKVDPRLRARALQAFAAARE